MVAALRIAADEKPTRLKNRVGDFSAPAAARVGRRVDAARGPHWEKRALDYDCTAAISFHENWNRFYDPQTGRYLSPEPLAHSLPQASRWPAYSYASNNPMHFTDPSGQFSLLGYCPNFIPALSYARSLAGGDGAPTNPHGPKSCECSEKIATCTHGCDVCPILSPGTPPIVAIVTGFNASEPPSLPFYKHGFTHQFKDPTKIGSQVSRVTIDGFLCHDPILVEELGRTLLHEALHVCVQETGTDIDDTDPFCGAKKVEDICD